MAHYVGVDIIEINRISQALTRWGERFLRRVYTAPEISAYGKNPSALAVRFASKEAVMKLLGTGARGVSWRDIETLHHASGQPFLNLYGRAQSEANKLGLREIAVSLSHSKEYAIASVASTSVTDLPR